MDSTLKQKNLPLGSKFFPLRINPLLKRHIEKKIVELLPLKMYPFTLNPFALSAAKTLWSFGHTECKMVNAVQDMNSDISYTRMCSFALEIFRDDEKLSLKVSVNQEMKD